MRLSLHVFHLDSLTVTEKITLFFLRHLILSRRKKGIIFKILSIFTPILPLSVCLAIYTQPTDVNLLTKGAVFSYTRSYLVDLTLPLFSYSLLIQPRWIQDIYPNIHKGPSGGETMLWPILIILSSESIGYRKRRFVQKNSFNYENLYFRCGYPRAILYLQCPQKYGSFHYNQPWEAPLWNPIHLLEIGVLGVGNRILFSTDPISKFACFVLLLRWNVPETENGQCDRKLDF